MLELALWAAINIVAVHTRPHVPAAQKHRALQDDGGQSCIDQHAVVRQMLETNPGFLPAQGADPDRLCEFVRLDSDTGASNQGAPGTPGTCDGSAWAEQLLANGGSVNELCPCSCPHVLDACAEGVRRTSSLPGSVGLRPTAESQQLTGGSCEVVLWADHDSHPEFHFERAIDGVTVSLYDGGDDTAPQLRRGSGRTVSATMSQLLLRIDYDPVLLADAGVLQLGEWITRPGSCANGVRDSGEQGADCGGPCPACRRGCTAPLADNWDAEANSDDGTCLFGRGGVPPCTDQLASNYASGSSFATGPEYRGACQYDCEFVAQQLAQLRATSGRGWDMYDYDGWTSGDIDPYAQSVSPAVCLDPVAFGPAMRAMQSSDDVGRVLLLADDMPELDLLYPGGDTAPGPYPSGPYSPSAWEYGGLVLQGDPSLPLFGSHLNLAFGFQLIARLVTFTGGTAISQGGAVFVRNYAYARFQHCQFRDSSAAMGGAIYVSPGSTLEMSGSTVKHCTAPNGLGGGGIYAISARVYISDSSFTGNSAVLTPVYSGSGTGGAILMEGGTLEIRSSSFKDSHIDSPVDVPGTIRSTTPITWFALEGEAIHLKSSFNQPLERLLVRDVTFEPFHPDRTVFTTGVRPAGCSENPCELGFGCSYSQYSLSCQVCGESLVGLDGITCSACGPGKEPNNDGMLRTHCVPCTEGYSIAGVCVPCPPGTEPTEDRTGCDKCEPGTVSTDGRCSRCGSGQHPNPSRTMCVDCPVGSYGAAGICIECPYFTKPNDQKTGCVCEQGRYNQTEGTIFCFESDFNEAYKRHVEEFECLACPPCATCPGDGPATISDGYGVPTQDMITSPADGLELNVFLCEQEKRCVRQPFCSADGTQEQKVSEIPRQNAGRWECSGDLIVNSSTTLCKQGHTGPLCAVCADGYGTYGGDGLCHACDESQPGIHGVMISAVVFAVVVTVIVIELKKYKRAVGKTRQIDGTNTLQNPLRASGPLSQLRQSIQFAVGHDESYEINRTQRRRASKLPILARVIFHPTKIVISFAQVLAALGPVLHIHLPPFMQVLSEFLRSFIFDIRSIVQVDCWKCNGGQRCFNYYFLWCIHIFAIPAMMFLIGELIAYFRAVRADGEREVGSRDVIVKEDSAKHKERLKHERRSIRFFMLFLMYPSLCNQAFGLFNCRQLGPQLQLLIVDYRIDCSTSTHQLFMVMSGLVIAFVVAGVPVFCLWKMIEGRNKLKEEKEKLKFEEVAKMVCQECGLGDKVDADMIRDIKMRQDFNFLIDAFTTRYYYWECVDLSRKCILTGAIVLFGRGSVAQIFLAVLISFGFFSMQMKFSPYRHWEDNWLKASTEAMIFFTIIVALVLRARDLAGERFQTEFYGRVLEALFFLLVPTAFFVVLVIKFRYMWRRVSDSSADPSIGGGTVQLMRASSNRDTLRTDAFNAQIRGDPHHEDRMVIYQYVDELIAQYNREAEARRKVAEAEPWSKQQEADMRSSYPDWTVAQVQQQIQTQKLEALHARMAHINLSDLQAIDQHLGTLQAVLDVQANTEAFVDESDAVESHVLPSQWQLRTLIDHPLLKQDGSILHIPAGNEKEPDRIALRADYFDDKRQRIVRVKALLSKSMSQNSYISLSQEAHEQVQREVAAMRELSHIPINGVPCTAIRQCLDYFYDARQTACCMILDEVGQTAEAVRAEREQSGKSVAEDDIIGMAKECMSALECMHTRGWLHTSKRGEGLTLEGIVQRKQGEVSEDETAKSKWLIANMSTARKMEAGLMHADPDSDSAQQRDHLLKLDIAMLGLAMIEFTLGQRREVASLSTTVPLTSTETSHPIRAHAPGLVDDLSKERISAPVAEVVVCAAARGYSSVLEMRKALENAIEEEDGYFLSHVQADQGQGSKQMMGLKTFLTKGIQSFFDSKLSRGSDAAKPVGGKTKNGNDLIWLDQDEVPSLEGMKAGVKRKKNFLLFLTVDYFKKPFCRYELRLALEQKKNIVLVTCEDRELGAAETFGNYIMECEKGMAEEKEKGHDVNLKWVFDNCVAIPYYTDKNDVETGRVKEPVFWKASLAQILHNGKAVGGGSYSLDGGKVNTVRLPPVWTLAQMRVLIWHDCYHDGDHSQAVAMREHLETELSGSNERSSGTEDLVILGEPAEDEGLLKGNQLHVLLLIYLTQRTLQMPQTVEKLKMARDCSRPVIVLREMDQRQERITKESVFGAVEMSQLERDPSWEYFTKAGAQFVPYYRFGPFRIASHRTVLTKWFDRVQRDAGGGGALEAQLGRSDAR